MRYLIDVIFSDWLYMTILIMVVMFTCVGFAFKNPFKSNALNKAYKVFLYLFAFSFMMSFSFLHYGLSDEFKRIYVGNTILVLQEEYERGGEGTTEYVTRMHILNKSNGKEILRKYIGSYGDVIGVSGDSVAFLNENSLTVIDGSTGVEYYEIGEDDWKNIIPELSAGVNRIDDNQNRDEFVKPFINIDCKNGKHYWMDPFTKKTFNKEPKDVYLPKFSKRKYDLYFKTDNQKSTYFLRTQATPNSKLNYLLPTGRGENLFNERDSTTYIEPFLMCIDTLQKIVVFGHYTTTDMEDFTIEARDFSFKPLWKYSTEQLKVRDRYNTYNCNVWEYEKGILYFNAGGYVIAVEPISNKVIWNTRH